MLYVLPNAPIYQPQFAGAYLQQNTGIGFEAALKLVNCNAKRVILGVRSISKGEDAKVDIEKRTGRKGAVDVWQVDMLDYTSIQNFAARVRNELDTLDYAILNAGIIPATFEKSTYGWESTLQVNFISTVLLAVLLLPKLNLSKTATFTPVLEIIGSGNHQRASVLPAVDDAAQDPLQVYNAKEVFGLGQYDISKLFLMYALPYLVELGKPDKSTVASTHVVVVCPAFTQSDLARDYLDKFIFRVIYASMKLVIAKTSEQGARYYVSGLEVGGAGNGRFYQYDKVQP